MPGDSTYVQRGIYEDGPASVYMHEECHAAMSDDFHNHNIGIDSETGQFDYELSNQHRGKSVNFQVVE